MGRLPILAVALCLAAPVHAQSCAELRFAPGASSGEIAGAVQPDGFDCFLIGTGAGQTMTVEVLSSDNIVVGIDGVADAQEAIRLTTAAGTYRLRITHLLRIAGPEPYRVVVTIR